MDKIKIIRNKTDYDEALELLGKLMDLDPRRGTPEAEKLEFLTLLIKDYESKTLEDVKVDPVEAITFRMEQLNLNPRDLIPFIGSRSKVSEVLSRKRPLTLSMVRALNKGMGIPTKSLIGEQDFAVADEEEMDWEKFPIKEMLKRGWLEAEAWKQNAQEAVQQLLEPIGSPESVMAFYRMTENIRSAREFDRYALLAWNAQVVKKAMRMNCRGHYKNGIVTTKFMTELVKLSVYEDGPQRAVEYLSDHGIRLVVEAHLPKTYLDGAVIANPQGPIISLTLRYDRIDNFWFSLVHELSHIALHLSKGISYFYDDLDVDAGSAIEKEADALAGEVLIPTKEWQNSIAIRLRTPEAAVHLANKLKINPAIVAGRMRKHFNSFHILNQLVGHGLVKKHFKDVNWGVQDV